MPQVSFVTKTLEKLYPLAISRGTMSSSENLFVTVVDGEFEGIGELSPATGSAWTAERGQAQLQAYVEAYGQSEDFLVPSINDLRMRKCELDPPAMAALDIALWDLLAKRARMPLHNLLGLGKTAVPTSVTIGINPPEVTRDRVPDIIRRNGAKCLKIKLGSPEGRDHDCEHFMAAAEAAAPFNVSLRVDANGGWTVSEAIEMIGWLAERSVEYVEQPLPKGSETDLPFVFHNRKLPIFVDESCRTSSDITLYAHCVDGINLKLMKCGGVTEALRIVATARAFGLKTMIGCMSESSIAIAAGSAIGALFDYIDLDSQLNLNPDPADGAEIVDGVVAPTDRCGHGGRFK
jgi:muconate cycloisomerase